MKVVITGGAGFIGATLALKLLTDGLAFESSVPEPINELVILDQVPPPSSVASDSRVLTLCLDLYHALANSDGRLAVALRGADLVFHLAAAVSGECEADFEFGMRANVDVTRGLLKECHRVSPGCRLIYSSSLAVYGIKDHQGAEMVINDSTMATPQTSYGHQKLICEHLVSDYARRNLLDARSVRLMTVVVRPGTPNGAASSFLSSIVREPFTGLQANCPVDLRTRFAVSSPSRTIQGLVRAAEVPRDTWEANEAMNLPALTVTPADLLDALQQVAGVQTLQMVSSEPQPQIQRIVESWPASFKATRAEALGLRPSSNAVELVEEFLATQSDPSARNIA